MTPEGREYLVRLNYLAMINSLLSQINEDYIRECQSTVSYGTPLWRGCHFLEYFSKLEASEIVSRVQTELIGALFNVVDGGNAFNGSCVQNPTRCFVWTLL